MIRNDIFDKVAGGSAHFLEHIDTDLEGFYRLEDRIKYLKVDFFSLSIAALQDYLSFLFRRSWPCTRSARSSRVKNLTMLSL